MNMGMNDDMTESECAAVLADYVANNLDGHATSELMMVDMECHEWELVIAALRAYACHAVVSGYMVDNAFAAMLPMWRELSDDISLISDDEFIAAANPYAVLAIIDRTRTAEAALNGALAAAADLRAENASLRALLREAGEALEPFGRNGSVISKEVPDDLPLEAIEDTTGDSTFFTVGGLRTARTIATKINEALSHE